MSRLTIAITVLMLLALLSAACVPIQAPSGASSTETSSAETLDAKIAEAMRGAGPPISAEATIMDWPPEMGGEWTVLREGANGWTCLPGMPYYPEGIGRPMCIDEVWLDFMKARIAGEEFAPVTKPGVAYMLAGGGGPSIVDPFVTEPGPDEEWIIDAPPHMMILTPGDISGYSRTPGPQPWAMFPDTSFKHLMLAVPMPVETDDASLDPKIAEAMRGAGPPISAGATIMDWPPEMGGEWTVLREGTNGWTCLPGMPYYPEGIGRPMCIDEVWLAFMKARIAGEEFAPVTKPGVAYMLAGGGGPSIVDPFVTEPGPDEEWIIDAPPHMMILTPGDLSGYSRTPGPQPWAMFPDTSFAHIMLAIPMPAQ